MFGRRKTQQQSPTLDDWKELFRERAAKSAATTPKAYVDGSPTNFVEHIEFMVKLADFVTARGDIEATKVCIFILFVLGGPNPPECTPEGVNTALNEGTALGRRLRQQGFEQESDGFAAVLSALGWHWKENGLLEAAAQL